MTAEPHNDDDRLPRVPVAAREVLAFPTPWPITTTGVVLDAQNHLRLAEVPAWPEAAGAAADRSWVSSLAVATGAVWFTPDPGDRLLTRDCLGHADQFGAMGPGHGPGRLTAAAGVAVEADGRALLVVDRAAGRVQRVDCATGQVRWVWEGLEDPEDVTIGPDGVVHCATARGVERLGPYRSQAVVWSSDELGGRPGSLAAVPVGEDPVVVIAVGGDQPRVVCRPIDGRYGPASASARLEGALGPLVGPVAPAAGPRDPAGFGAPLMVRAGGGRLLVGSCPTGRVAVVGLAPVAPLGVIDGRPFAALAVDATCGVLWVSDGVSVAPSSGSVPVARGTAAIGPVPLRIEAGVPHQLRLRAEGRAGPGDLELVPRFVGLRSTAMPAEMAPSWAAAHDKVTPVPDGSTAVTIELTLIRPPAAAPGTGSTGAPTGPGPVVEAVELRIDEPGLIELLPAIYRAEGDPAAFLDPFLRLAGSAVDDVVDRLVELPDQFDPRYAVDDVTGERWLDWLATWVDVHLDERWPAERRRAAVAGAFVDHEWRGTARGLLRVLERELGLVDATIMEPADLASVWALGAEGAELGLGTMTVAAPPDGSIVGVTAGTDRSHLTGTEDYGAPLFGDVAGLVHVLVHQASVAEPGAVERLSDVVARELPLHARGHICVIKPGIRLGLGSRIGIDMVIGRGDDPRAVAGLDGFRSGPAAAQPPSLGQAGPMVLQ